ncbi:MAG: hypothetical protein H8E38_06720 [SAR324 cluster bacterium]|nr:hypothetical protein [SAR324 cluster bacterium]MBL7034759.1 hypothetical protein [SAR324 cluster bacterium]
MNVFQQKHFSQGLTGTINSAWLRSPAWDAFWIHSGLWLTLLMFTVKSAAVQEMFYAAGVFLFWISHRFSSFYLAWGTQAYRPLLKKQQWRFIYFPLLLILLVFAALFLPQTIIIIPVSERIIGLLLLDFCWGIHHFSAQHYGILRLYHHRWNPENAPSANQQERWYCWGVGGGLVFIAELLHGTSFLQEKNILPLLTADMLIEVLPMLLRFGTLIVIGTTYFMIQQAWKNESGWPRILYILGVGVLVSAAFQLEPVQFLMLWTLQHWLVAVGLTAHMGSNDFPKKTNEVTVLLENKSGHNTKKAWLLVLIFCVFSIVLTPFFEIEAVSAGERYSEQVLPMLMEWLNNSSWLRLLVGVGLASGFLHYFMDRAVYRFSDPETRTGAQRLLLA